MSKEAVLAEILGVDDASEALDEMVAALTAQLQARGITGIAKSIGGNMRKQLTPSEMAEIEEIIGDRVDEAVADAVEFEIMPAVEETVDEAVEELTETDDYDEDEEEKADEETDLAARVAAIEETLARVLAMLEEREKALRPKRASQLRETVVALDELMPELKMWGTGGETQTFLGRKLRGGVK